MSVNSVFAGRYKLLQRISVSAGIELWKAEDIKTTDIVSLKISAVDSDTFSRAQLLKEFMVLTQIRHPHLLTPLHYDDFESQPYLVFPYTEGYSLKQYNLNNAVLTEDNARKLLLSGTKALAALHESGICHRNIIPSNIYLLNGVFMLGPFKRQSETILSPDVMPYLAPELMNADVDYTVKSDVYSLAAVVYESCTHRFLQKSNLESGQIKLPHQYSESFQQLLAKCLSIQPELRPSLSEIILSLEDAAKPAVSISSVVSNIVAKEPVTPVIENTTVSTVETLVANSANSNITEEPTIKQGDRKKANRMVAVLCILILFLAVYIQLMSSVKVNSNVQVAQNGKQHPKMVIEENVELPSEYLNINSLSPDTNNYDFESEIQNSENSINTEVKRRSVGKLHAFKDADGTYGFKDMKNNVVIMPAYDDVFEFSEGLAAVKVKELWGFIDVKGNWIVKPKYNNPGVFSEGRAKVEENGNVMFINKSGTCIGGCIVVSHLN